MNNIFDSPNIDHKLKKFPCMFCLVKASCIEYVKCDLVTKNQKDIFYWISIGMCPDCACKDKIIKIKPFLFKCMECRHEFKQRVGDLMERV